MNNPWADHCTVEFNNVHDQDLTKTQYHTQKLTDSAPGSGLTSPCKMVWIVQCLLSSPTFHLMKFHGSSWFHFTLIWCTAVKIYKGIVNSAYISVIHVSFCYDLCSNQSVTTISFLWSIFAQSLFRVLDNWRLGLTIMQCHSEGT